MAGTRHVLIVLAVLCAAGFGVPWVGGVPDAAAQVSVSNADPAAGEQGTLSLNVTISGKGFKSGAVAKFFKTKTTDPAGVNVKATRFVSSTQLVATIDIADSAALSLFDIQVQNADGRTGKGTELFTVVQKGAAAKLDVELVVSFDCTAGPGLCDDGKGDYQSGSGVMSKIEFNDYGEHGVGGSFALEVWGTDRALMFDFGEPLPYDGSSVCPDRCPGPPEDSLPNFAVEPIQKVSVRTIFGWAAPNYDFLNPTVCDYNSDRTPDWVPDEFGPYCVTDAMIRIETAQKIFYLRFSPNVQRRLAQVRTLYGAMKVRYSPASNQWRLEPLPSYDFGNGDVQQELCPAMLERRVLERGKVTYKFVGCYDMPFGLTLRRR